MSRGARKVNNVLRTDKMNVFSLFRMYTSDKLYVNRRYQRKLVWGVEEQRLLVDSILKEIPLPSVFLINCEYEDSKYNHFEIVDGMQRIFAIVSFLLGDFAVEYEGEMCYFDPMQDAVTARLLQEGKIKERDTYLPSEVCERLMLYGIPVTMTNSDDEMIDLIFRRLNSTGKIISSHDLRQASFVGEFPDLVRRIASNLRKDHTYDDKICLCDMKKISIGAKEDGYGVTLDSVFWTKHNLLTSKLMKESYDEEIIETAFAYYYLGYNFNKSKGNLDLLYDDNTVLGGKVVDIIDSVGKDCIEDLFNRTFNVIDSVFSRVGCTISEYLFHGKLVYKHMPYFYALFLAFYKLCENGYYLAESDDIESAMSEVKEVFANSVKPNRCANLDTLVSTLYKIMASSMSRTIVAKNDKFVTELERRLSYSTIEQQMTEFKIGITYFKDGKVNKRVLEDVLKTIVAMSNTDVSEDGLVVIGIADNNSAYSKWDKIYDCPAMVCNGHYVVGITSEAMRVSGSVDKYYRCIRKYIDNTDSISDDMKKYVLSTYSVVSYYDKELLVFRSTSELGNDNLYRGEKWVRRGNETVRERLVSE